MSSSFRFRSPRLAGAVCAAALLVGAAVPAAASAEEDAPAPGIVDIVLDVSGTEGFDRDPNDYDLLREALLATGLAGAVADATDITVFAPRDVAFVRLARDLGFEGWNEAKAFAFLAEATGFVSADEPGLLDDVLLYHVAPGAQTLKELRQAGPVNTLLDVTLEVEHFTVIDQDPDDADARIAKPRDLEAANGIIHTVNRVLRPIDLGAPEPEPAPEIVDVVVAVSGAEGFDDNGADYDILRDALVATELAGALAGLDDVNVFAPTDAAFIALAQDLGYAGSDEAGAFGAIAAATGFESAASPGLLADVLLYHVSANARSVAELNADGPFPTLQGDRIEVVDGTVVDADPNDADAEIVDPKDLVVRNGIIQTVDQVLRPLDLDAPEPTAPSIVDIVVETSGAEGFDRNFRDYDTLREALKATGLLQAIIDADDITVLAPNDYSFLVAAYQLGYHGRWNEADVFAFLAEATGYVSADEPGLLDDILLYHVLPGGRTVKELRNSGEQATLLPGATVRFGSWQIADNDPNAGFNPFFSNPRNIEASNGYVHTIFGVLRPIDL